MSSVTVDGLRKICRALPAVTEDVKWGQDLAFCVGGKMFAVVNLEPPHQLSFKCTPETFGELTERPGLIPAPYLARASWVQEPELGATLDRQELEALIRTSYALVHAKLPKRARMAGEAGKRGDDPRPAAAGRHRGRARRKRAAR